MVLHLKGITPQYHTKPLSPTPASFPTHISEPITHIPYVPSSSTYHQFSNLIVVVSPPSWVPCIHPHYNPSSFSRQYYTAPVPCLYNYHNPITTTPLLYSILTQHLLHAPTTTTTPLLQLAHPLGNTHPTFAPCPHHYHNPTTTTRPSRQYYTTPVPCPYNYTNLTTTPLLYSTLTQFAPCPTTTTTPLLQLAHPLGNTHPTFAPCPHHYHNPTTTTRPSRQYYTTPVPCPYNYTNLTTTPLLYSTLTQFAPCPTTTTTPLLQLAHPLGNTTPHPYTAYLPAKIEPCAQHNTTRWNVC